jgi:acyl-CoA synthetase (AMP-forming)/AMP-acid ligase II
MGLEPGDLVSLYSQNSPEYIFILFGLWAIGCAPAMINWNLGGDALVHCANLAGAKVMIVDEEPGCQARIAEQKPRLECELVTLSERLKAEIASSDASRPADSYRESLAENAPACLIYTRFKGNPLLAAAALTHHAAEQLECQRHSQSYTAEYMHLELWPEVLWARLLERTDGMFVCLFTM